MKGSRCAVTSLISQLWIVPESFIVSIKGWSYFMKLNINCWITGLTFDLQARSTRESEIIGREGPVGVGQPGVVRAPSGLIMGLPATATPASKGEPARKSSFFPPNSFFYYYCHHLSWFTCCCRPAGCFMGGAKRRQQVGEGGVDRRRASVRHPTQRSSTQVHRRWLHPAQDAREGQLREGTGDDHTTTT